MPRGIPSNSDDIIDGRDVQSRIDDLESETDGAVMVAPSHLSPMWSPLLLDIVQYGWESNTVRRAIERGYDWTVYGDPDDYASDDDAELSEAEAAQMRADRCADDGRDVTDEMHELLTLRDFADDLSSDALVHGESLIREDYFETAMQDDAESCGLLGEIKNNPLVNCIDWEKWADMCRADYATADFDGVTYYYRG